MAHILVLEPDAVMSKIYHQVLQSLGHNVHTSRTAQQAVHATDDNLPELIIMELQLIGHSGIEFLYELRSYTDWKNIPVIVMSHVPPQEFAASSSLLKHTLGVSEYFYKPQTSLSSLLGSVRRLLPAPITTTENI
jgi:DNA-binding response OmpR family regulator